MSHRLCESGRLYADQLARFRYRPEAARQGLKQLTSARARLRTTLTNLKKSLHSHLELVFPALLATPLDPASARVAAILAAAPTAGAWPGTRARRSTKTVRAPLPMKRSPPLVLPPCTRSWPRNKP